MNDELIPFGPGALAVIGGYICSLIVICAVAYRARRDNSLDDFYLGGRGIGFVVLLLTLYATQYSGNTLLGFSGTTYRIGYSWIMCLHFMTAIVVFYQVFAPKLRRLAQDRRYVTPTDYLKDRFGSTALTVLASVIMIVALANYLLGQLMAMGRALQGLTSIDPKTAYVYGVVFLALVIVVYESLGGFRAVAWTDMIQGLLLIAGFAVLLLLVFERYGSLETATETVLARADGAAKVRPPSWERIAEWLSYVLIVGMGGALYPQAIQRIYAAKSAATLRRSLAVMAFLPLTTTLVAVIVGVVALANFPGLEGPRADSALMVLCRDVQESSLLGYWMVVLIFAALLAAIMSTADSALLSISSMVTKDLYAPYVAPRATEAELTRVGKLVSWALVAVLVGLALWLRTYASLVELLDRKFDLLVQLVPAFFIGIHWRRMRAGPTLGGLVVGVAVAVTMAAIGLGKLHGVHAGLYGLAANLAVAVGGSLMAGPPRPRPSRA